MVNIRIWMPTYHIGAASRIIRVMPFGFGQQVAGLDSWQFGYINPEDELSLCRYSMSNLPDGTILCLAIKLKSEKFRDSISARIDLSEVKISSIIFSEVNSFMLLC